MTLTRSFHMGWIPSHMQATLHIARPVSPIVQLFCKKN